MTRRLPLLIAVIAGLMLGAAGAAAPWRWKLPPGIGAPEVPADNVMNAAKVALGRRLFYEADLSIDGTMACATCHEQWRGFADGNRTHPGVHGDPGRRNVPGLANIAWINPLTSADPQLTSLEAQAAVPVLGVTPIEMGMRGQEPEIARRLGRDACYRQMFTAAFPEAGGRIDLITVSKALAAFERTLLSYDSPYDRRRRDEAALPAPAARGAALFETACSGCHAGLNFTDGGFHRIATSGSGHDTGLAEKSGHSGDVSRFRTAALRNIALAPPYLHDGSAPTLAEAIRRHDALAPIGALSAPQIDDLVAFIQKLTDRRFIADRRFALPDKACGKRL